MTYIDFIKNLKFNVEQRNKAHYRNKIK